MYSYFHYNKQNGGNHHLYVTSHSPQSSSGPDRGEFTPLKTMQYTVNSTFSLNCKVQPQCNGNEKFSLKMTQQGRNM
jgi:hypothetical protein